MLTMKIQNSYSLRLKEKTWRNCRRKGLGSVIEIRNSQVPNHWTLDDGLTVVVISKCTPFQHGKSKFLVVSSGVLTRWPTHQSTLGKFQLSLVWTSLWWEKLRLKRSLSGNSRGLFANSPYGHPAVAHFVRHCRILPHVGGEGRPGRLFEARAWFRPNPQGQRLLWLRYGSWMDCSHRFFFVPKTFHTEGFLW